MKKYGEKLANSEVYGMSDIQNSLLLGAKILKKTDKMKISNKKLSEVDQYIQEFNNASPQLMENISKLLTE